jgi:hypothetical protein
MSTRFNARPGRLASAAAFVMVSMAGAPALAQQLGGARPVEVPVIQLVAGLALCSLAAFAAIAVMKKRAGAAFPSLFKWKLPGAIPAGSIKVLETHRLSVHADLCRFTAADREYLVIVSAGAVTVLRDEPLSIDAARPAQRGAA